MEEPLCDADGLYGGRLVPREQATLLVYLSWLGFITGLVGIAYGWKWYGLAVCVGSVLAQMYWSDPTYSWRRTLDITWVQGLIWLHLIAAWSSSVFWPYMVIQLTGVVAYALSWLFLKQGRTWPSTLAHATVHLCANGSLLLLYCM